MDWKELGSEIAKIGLPLLGAALPVPGGAAIGAALASNIGAPSDKPEDILATLTGNSDAVLKAREFEATHQEKMLQITSDNEIAMRKAESADMATVNATMQKESDNSDKEAWYQKAWRPANGFAVAAGSFVAVIFVCAIFYHALNGGTDSKVNWTEVSQVVAIIPSLATAIASILAIPGAAVGISAWHRGQLKRDQAKQVQQP